MSEVTNQPAEPVDRESQRFLRFLRTREAQASKKFREELARHVGGAPNTVQNALIERAVQIKLRLSLMDRRFLEAGAEMSLHDSRSYLAWSNSLTRTLRELGVESPAERAPSLAELLAAPPPPEAAQDAPSAPPAAPAPGRRARRPGGPSGATEAA